MLEAIERGTLASKQSCGAMKSPMRRQQAGARRIPHFLDVPVAHQTGDSAVIANDVGMVYSRSGPVAIAFFTNGITGTYAETEDRIGRLSLLFVDYFHRATTHTRLPPMANYYDPTPHLYEIANPLAPRPTCRVVLCSPLARTYTP